LKVQVAFIAGEGGIILLDWRSTRSTLRPYDFALIARGGQTLLIGFASSKRARVSKRFA